jgi:septal ring-binding cell division protein DamX
VASQTQDDGFHEIQLNGKQLVFLFMAATVISVAIFLCGVLVGRGARTERGGASDTSTSVAETTPQQPATPAPAPAGSDPTTVPAPPAVDDLSYFNRLEKQNAPAEQLKPAPDRRPAEKPAPAERSAAVAARPAQEPPSVPAAKEPARAPAPETAPEPSGQGFAVQIAALNVRTEAEAIARRLSSKGYAAYVLSPANGTPAVYRVRVGKFNTRREAESVAARLQQEEQFKPWVTR